MFYTNTYHHIIEQAGTTQMGDMNNSLPNHLLQTAVLTNHKETYQPTRFSRKPLSFKNFLLNLVGQLIWLPERTMTTTSQVSR
jgi:hypothetical protein